MLHLSSSALWQPEWQEVPVPAEAGGHLHSLIPAALPAVSVPDCLSARWNFMLSRLAVKCAGLMMGIVSQP